MDILGKKDTSQEKLLNFNFWTLLSVQPLSLIYYVFVINEYWGIRFSYKTYLIDDYLASFSIPLFLMVVSPFFVFVLVLAYKKKVNWLAYIMQFLAFLYIIFLTKHFGFIQLLGMSENIIIKSFLSSLFSPFLFVPAVIVIVVGFLGIRDLHSVRLFFRMGLAELVLAFPLIIVLWVVEMAHYGIGF